MFVARSCLVLSLLIDCARLQAPAQAPPNVVLVMADDLGWGDVGFLGGTDIRTPQLDAMAANGLGFTRFYAAAPVCSPTRGSVLTGRHPYRYGVRSANVGHLPAAEHTLPELLAAAGYATGHFGKWHLGTLTPTVKDSNRGGPRGAEHFAPPWEHGVEDVFVTEAKVPTYDPMRKPVAANNRTWPPITDDAAEFYGTRYWTGPETFVDPEAEELRGDDSRIVMDRALAFVERAVRHRRPFLAVVWFHAPHLPVVADGDHKEPYADGTDYQASYRGCVAALDEQVGRLRTRLRELAVADNTIVFFCSDNGPEGTAGQAPGSAGPLRGRKRDLYEGGIRVPGIVEWPARIRAGSRTAVPCSTSDYLPTILEATGIRFPDPDRPMDGVSLVPLIVGEEPISRQPIGFEHGRQVALLGERFKILSTDQGKTFALYDLVADPDESEDVAAEHVETLEAMTATMRAWRDSCARSAAGADYR